MTGCDCSLGFFNGVTKFPDVRRKLLTEFCSSRALKNQRLCFNTCDLMKFYHRQCLTEVSVCVLKAEMRREAWLSVMQLLQESARPLMNEIKLSIPHTRRDCGHNC